LGAAVYSHAGGPCPPRPAAGYQTFVAWIGWRRDLIRPGLP
jgi:hypothetical protein